MQADNEKESLDIWMSCYIFAMTGWVVRYLNELLSNCYISGWVVRYLDELFSLEVGRVAWCERWLFRRVVRSQNDMWWLRHVYQVRYCDEVLCLDGITCVLGLDLWDLFF